MLAVNPGCIILTSTTIKPASAGMSVRDQLVTAAAADDLYADSTNILGGPIGAIAVSDTAANTVTNLISSNEAFSGSDPAWLVAGGAAESIALRNCSSSECQI